MNAYKKIDQLRKPESAMCWLYKIALNVSRSYIKSNKLKNVMSYEDLSDLSHSVSQDVDFDSDLGRLTEAVKVLPEKFRQAVVLHYLEHLTIAESAEVAGVREGTFKSRLNRALKRLERSLKINGEVDCVCR
jgi:RNA polymerase sigma-70 factor (ECF subfamily)